jgi:hypothetical protein
MWPAAVAAAVLALVEPLVLPVLLTRCRLPWCPGPVLWQEVGVVEAPLTLLLLLLPPVLLVLLPLALMILLHHQGAVEGVHLQAGAVLAEAAAAVMLLPGAALRRNHTAASKPGWGRMPAGSNRYSHSLGGSIPLGAGTPHTVVP